MKGQQATGTNQNTGNARQNIFIVTVIQHCNR